MTPLLSKFVVYLSTTTKTKNENPLFTQKGTRKMNQVSQGSEEIRI